MDEHDCGEHCPFLNRSDRRCSSFLSLDRIAHAFDHCFGEYKSCPMYFELLVERRVRRLSGLLSPVEQGGAPAHGTPYAPARRPVVRLTVGQSHATSAGASAQVAA
jgi:hypothetical protein